MDTSQPDYRRYLDPDVLAKISGLELRARLIVEGFFSGMHHSPTHGASVEFADHRAYAQGDDLRYIDWKLFGKTDKYYIKEFEQETNLDVMLVVDNSESMHYRGASGAKASDRVGMTKFEYATAVSAAISYLALQQQDSVGLSLFDERLTEFLKPSNSMLHWKTLVQELSGQAGRAKTSLERVLHELAERLGHRMLIMLISDLFDDCDEILRGLKHLRYRHHEIVVMNVWDAAELTFPFSGPMMFDGLESMGKLLVDPRSLRDRYLEEVERFRKRLRSGCGHMQIDYVVFNTTDALDIALSGYLATRSARLRQRSSRVLGAG
ncbi:MAG: DUF58 domain-containing protein [Phycisphaerae bacterium]